MMKLAIISAGALAATLPSVAAAQSGDGLRTVFECALRNGKTVRVTSQGGNLFYHYGQRNRSELSLRGSPRSETVFFMRQRYAGPQMQLRFTNGGYSYIVHNMEGNPRVGARGVSGLVVMRGQRRIADYPCRRYSEFRASFDLLDSLPEDSEAYSAM
jgi:hypothetical protein